MTEFIDEILHESNMTLPEAEQGAEDGN